MITASNPAGLIHRARSLGIEKNLSIIIERDFQVIVPLLLRADVACSTRTLPSGFPIKVLSCLAAGLPVVCYRSGAKGITDGETGLVGDDGDVEALGRAILRLLTNDGLRGTMAQKARAVALRDYNWRDLAGEIEKVQRAVMHP